MRETVVPVCSPQFLAENPVERPDRLLQLPLLEMASRPRAWEHWFASLGIEASYPPGMRFEQLMNVSQACAAGLGVALMPLFLIESELESGQLVRAFDWPIESVGGWDAHNVTEDADLGVRLMRRGYRTELIDTVTGEEANARPWP